MKTRKLTCFTLLLFALFSIGCGDIEKGSQVLQKAEANAKVEPVDQKSDEPAKPVSPWRHQLDKDEMTDEVTHYYLNNSLNSIRFAFPYEGGSTATFQVRVKGKKKEIIYSISKGQFIGSSLNDGKAVLRFDDEPPMTVSMNEPSDYSSDLVFLGSEQKILSKLKTAKTLKIQTEFYQEGNRVFEFNVSDFKEVE